jgi:signal transduction histidine kinase
VQKWRAILVCVLLTLEAPAAARAKAKNVLVLSGGRGRVSINQMQASLRARFPDPVNFSIVDLENPRFGQADYQDHFAEALRSGYSGDRPDLIVAVMTPSLEFAVKYHDKLFPGVPIVFMSINPPLPEKMGAGVTGVESPQGIPEIINLALRLHPDTETVAVISNVTNVDKDWLAAERVELLRHRDKVREIDLIGPPSPELLQKVAALPPHTVVLFQLFPQDSDQPAFGAFDVLAPVAQRLPTYSILSLLDRGAIGVATYDATNDAVVAGQLAARLLSGERADNIPIVQNSNVLVSVDWRQLQRWNIPESALPPGTRVLFRDPTIWQRYWKYILATSAVMVVQSFLIVGLLWQRARTRKAEAVLRGLGGKLIAAQEEERTRIARELHDDVNQQLAFLSVSLEELRQDPLNSTAALDSRIEHLRTQASEISSSVQGLSHRLHSSKLEYLGLAAALRGFCREFSTQHRVEVTFSHEPLPDALPPDVSLCLFRVVQAALVNGLKHSGAKSFDVHLQSSSGKLHLTIRDEGVGFDVEKVLGGNGLGLISMRERVRFVSGTISIQSAPNRGTTIQVDVPVPVKTTTSQSA